MDNDTKSLTKLQDSIFPEITTLELNNSFNQLVAIMPEHNQMLDIIKESLPEIQRSTSLFFKTQSMFMDNMMTVNHNTPLRNIRQILAEMNRTRDAIKETVFKLKKKEIELKMKKREIEVESVKSDSDNLKIEMLQLEVMEIIDGADSARGYISGAIRRLTNYTEQYNSIITKYGIQNFTEKDFEKEEEKYHIKKAFEQGLTAARSRGGIVDEGNFIYFTQIGINGATAQFYISKFLNAEQELFKEGKAPTHKAYLDFLEEMAKVFADSAKTYAESKGMCISTETAMIKNGDDRLLK